MTRLAVVSTDQTPTIYADIGLGRLLPVRLMGDGMSRIFSIALAIASAPGGIVLVDEIENGIHHSVMEKVWKAIGAFATNITCNCLPLPTATSALGQRTAPLRRTRG